jgi:hypothetical protein
VRHVLDGVKVMERRRATCGVRSRAVVGSGLAGRIGARSARGRATYPMPSMQLRPGSEPYVGTRNDPGLAGVVAGTEWCGLHRRG